MITALFVSLGFWTLYLYSDAYQDVDHQKKYGAFSHQTNFYCRAVVGTALVAVTVPYLDNIFQLILFGGWMVTYGWIFFDLAHNKLAKQEYSYVGTSFIDLWFKEKFPDDYKKTMWAIKLRALIINTILLIASLAL